MSTTQPSSAPPAEAHLRLYAEEATLTRETVETGRLHVGKHTHTREQLIEADLAHETVEITTVPVGVIIDAMPAIRDDGETLVIPIVEEILVVERRLRLKEEVHVRRIRTTERHRETVTLRHQEAAVTRLPPKAPGGQG
jgi:uncharacterized protein (TIGR02271 family)